MKTPAQIFEDVHAQLKLGYSSVFIASSKSEHNLNEDNSTMQIVFDNTDLSFDHDLANGGSVYSYPIRLLFLKLDELSNLQEGADVITAECFNVSNKFINLLRKYELVKVSNIKGVFIYDYQDENLTGVYITFTLTQNSIDSLCTLQ